MENQFTDLTKPNIDEEYYCTDNIRSKGFTHLMKLVLVVRKFPEATEMIKDIITKDPKGVNESNEIGFTALTLAASAACSLGDKAAMYSATFSNVETVQMLINAGADVNFTDKEGYTVLMNACEYPGTSSFETVQMLINAGADVNMKDMHGGTALIVACRRSKKHDNFLTIKALIDAGADVNVDNDGYVPLVLVSEYSDRYNNIEIVKLLINAGADVNIISTAYYGYNALMTACGCFTSTENTETVKMLIDAGADVNYVNPNDGSTALMLACGNDVRSSNVDVIRMLIDAGADVNIKDRIKDTPLIKFIKSGLDESKKDTLLLLMRLSTSTICDKKSNNMSAYDYYKFQYGRVSSGILNESELQILKGKIAFNNTKSARK